MNIPSHSWLEWDHMWVWSHATRWEQIRLDALAYMWSLATTPISVLCCCTLVLSSGVGALKPIEHCGEDWSCFYVKFLSVFGRIWLYACSICNLPVKVEIPTEQMILCVMSQKILYHMSLKEDKNVRKFRLVSHESDSLYGVSWYGIQRTVNVHLHLQHRNGTLSHCPAIQVLKNCGDLSRFANKINY